MKRQTVATGSKRQTIYDFIESGEAEKRKQFDLLLEYDIENCDLLKGDILSANLYLVPRASDVVLIYTGGEIEISRFRPRPALVVAGFDAVEHWRSQIFGVIQRIKRRNKYVFEREL